MENQYIRKRKTTRIMKQKKQTMFRIPKATLKTMLIYLCLFQGLAVISLGVYVITYHPWLVEDDPADAISSTYNDEPTEDKDGFTNKLSRVAEEGKTADGKVYSIFRFDKFRNGRERPITDIVSKDGDFVYFSKAKNYYEHDLPAWVEQKVDYDQGRFQIYGGRVVRMKEVQINPSFGSGKLGGEEIENVMNQNLEDEYITLQKGYFMYKTENSFSYDSPVSSEIQKMEQGLLIETLPKDKIITQVKKKDRVAIVTIRYEYANFYHSTMNWYDVFLILVLFKLDPRNVDIIWLDAHPKSKLDNIWVNLYGLPVRAGSLNKPITYEEMIWNGIGSRSQMNAHKLQDLPFANEFRHFVLSKFSVPVYHNLHCGSVKVSLIWRRDHVTHPRNPSGFVSRKIENEEEILQGIREADGSLVVNGVQLDELPMRNQLEMVSKTDILIGMHGAGMSHILYLPQTSGVIELYPNYFSPSHSHFRSMAKWRRMPYMLWQNDDQLKDSREHKTYVTVDDLKDMVIKMKSIICK